MDGVVGRGRIFQAQAGVVEGAGDEVVELAGGAADLEGGTEGVKAAAIERKFVVIQVGAGFGGHIHDAGGVKAELGGEAAVDEGGGLDEVGVEFLGEAFEWLRQQDAVDAVGEVGVLAADVLAAERIEDDAGGAQQNLVEGGILAAGDVLDLLRADGVGDGAEAGGDIGPRGVERADDDFLQVRRHVGRFGVGRRRHGETGRGRGCGGRAG